MFQNSCPYTANQWSTATQCSRTLVHILPTSGLLLHNVPELLSIYCQPVVYCYTMFQNSCPYTANQWSTATQCSRTLVHMLPTSGLLLQNVRELLSICCQPVVY